MWGGVALADLILYASMHVEISLTYARYRYCRMLEEGSFRGRTADFVFMFIFGGTIMTVSLIL